MTAIVGDVTQFAQVILCRALEDAKSEDPIIRRSAHYWLTSSENYLRELILESATPDLHQDWIDAYVREIKEEFDE